MTKCRFIQVQTTCTPFSCPVLPSYIDSRNLYNLCIISIFTTCVSFQQCNHTLHNSISFTLLTVYKKSIFFYFIKKSIWLYFNKKSIWLYLNKKLMLLHSRFNYSFISSTRILSNNFVLHNTQ